MDGDGLLEGRDSTSLSADEFQALEAKVLQAVEMIRRERDARAAVEAERNAAQAEVATLLKEGRAAVDPTLSLLYQHPWHRREFGSHLTNVLRALTLEAFGYQVTVTELTGWEDRKSTRLNSSHSGESRMPSSA